MKHTRLNLKNNKIQDIYAVYNNREFQNNNNWVI